MRGGAGAPSRRTARPPQRQGKHDDAPGGSGTEARGGRAIRRAPVTVVFGSPLTVDDGEDARRFGVRLEQAVAVLADEVTTDWWQARRRRADGTTPSHRGPDLAPWLRSWALGRGGTARRAGRHRQALAPLTPGRRDRFRATIATT